MSVNELITSVKSLTTPNDRIRVREYFIQERRSLLTRVKAIEDYLDSEKKDMPVMNFPSGRREEK